jgi:hypothetical protein
MTYSLEETATGNDATTQYAAWLTNFNEQTRRLDYSTSNTALKNEYEITIRATLDDPFDT